MSKKYKRQSTDISYCGLAGRLENVLQYVQELIEKYGAGATITIDGYDVGVTLYYEVLETDAEYQRRIKKRQAARERAKKREAEKKEEEYKEFLRLQKKFGDK